MTDLNIDTEFIMMKPEYFTLNALEVKRALSKAISNDVEEFLKNGGKIKQYDKYNNLIE